MFLRPNFQRELTLYIAKSTPRGVRVTLDTLVPELRNYWRLQASQTELCSEHRGWTCGPQGGLLGTEGAPPSCWW